MSGMPDDWAAGGRRVRQADGRRTRRSDGRHARKGRADDEQAPEFALPEVPDLDEDDPKTLAEDAQWAAKLRPGRAPAGPDHAAPTGEAAPTAAPSTDSWAPAAASPSPSTGGDPWEASPSDGTGEVWGSSPGASGAGTAEPWTATPPSTSTSSGDLWGASPAGGASAAGASTGDWTSPGGAFEPERPAFEPERTPFEPERPASDWSLGTAPAAPATPAAPPSGSDTGSWAGIGGGSGAWTGGTDPATPWEPDADVDPWAPEPTSRQPWESASDPSTIPPFRSTTTPRAPSAMPWEAKPAPAPTASEPSTSSGADFRELFAELARDREAAPPPATAPAAAGQGEDPAVQAAHAEARRLIEEATGQWMWDADKRTGTGEVAAPTTGYRTGSAYGLPQPGGAGSPTAFGHGGQVPGATPGGYGGSAGPSGPGTDPGRSASAWSEPLPPPPVPDGSGPYGAALSFAPPGSAPTEVGPSATPPPSSRELTPTRGPGRHERSDEPLWTPDRRAGEDDTGGVGWLWSVEEHGASPPVPGSWLREPPKPQVREVDGLARSIEGRRLRQLEGRGQGRRVRRSRRWPVRIAVASWLVLFAVLCWLYFFPWLEGVLPENF